MVSYWLNLESTPLNISSLAFANTSATVFQNQGETINDWPYVNPPVLRRRLSSPEARKYKNLVLASTNNAWYSNRTLLLLTNTSFPFPYAAAPGRRYNTIAVDNVAQLALTYNMNQAAVSPFNHQIKVGINNAAALNGIEIKYRENDESARELGMWPGKAGDQFDFRGTIGDTAITYGEPQILNVYRHQLTDFFRPFHFFESDGTVFDPSSSPYRDNFLMYNGNIAFSKKPAPANLIPNGGMPGYYLNKTSEFGGGDAFVRAEPNNCPYPANNLGVNATIRDRTKFYPETITINGNTIQSSSLISNPLQQVGEKLFKNERTGNYNEQHTSWNMITSYVALTGDYMVEDEFQFLIIPELAQYRPWRPFTRTGENGIGKEGPRYPGGGEREFGRKLLCYTQAMRVTTGRTFNQLYALAKVLCDVVENTFRAESDNYRGETLGNICYTVSYGDRGTNAANRIYNFGASSINGNFLSNRTDFWLPWQQSYSLRGLEAFTKYAPSEKYRDLLLRFCRTLFLFGVYLEGDMPEGRNGVYNTSAASAPGMWAGAYKFVNYLKLVYPNEPGSGGLKYAPILKYLDTISGIDRFHEADWMYYLSRETNAQGQRTRIYQFAIRPFFQDAPQGVDPVPFRAAQRGVGIPETSPSWPYPVAMPEFSSSPACGGVYGSARTHYGWTVSAGFSSHPTYGGYIVSGLVPTGIEDTAFSTEFNRVAEMYDGYLTWLAPAAQVVLNTVVPSDELRFPRILEAKAIAEDLINRELFGPKEIPSNYRTLLGFDTPDIQNAPIVPSKFRETSYELVSQYLVYRPIP